MSRTRRPGGLRQGLPSRIPDCISHPFKGLVAFSQRFVTNQNQRGLQGMRNDPAATNINPVEVLLPRNWATMAQEAAIRAGWFVLRLVDSYISVSCGLPFGFTEFIQEKSCE